MKDHLISEPEVPMDTGRPRLGPMTAADFQMEGSRLLALGLPCWEHVPN